MKLRKFTHNDLNTMKLWLAQDYIQKYFGNPQDWIDEIAANLNADWVKYFIVEHNTPIGFVQYYETDIAPQGEWSDEPIGTVGIDYLIGNVDNKDYQRHGIAANLLSKIERKARLQGNKTIYSDVSLTAKGFFEKHGYIVEKQQLKRSKNKELVNFRMTKSF
jgi:GNAT superfamily N-acetyltransferase